MVCRPVFANRLWRKNKAKKIIEKIDNINLGLNITEDFTMAMAIAPAADAAKEIAEELKNGLEQVKGFGSDSRQKKWALWSTSSVR